MSRKATEIDPVKMPSPIRELSWAIIAIVLLILTYAATENTGGGINICGYNLTVPCYFRMVFHLPCPSCGLTRSMVAALHLNIAEAWRQNWAGIWVIIGWLLFILWRARRAVLLWRGKELVFLAEKDLWGKIGIIYSVIFSLLTIGNWISKVMMVPLS